MNSVKLVTLITTPSACGGRYFDIASFIDVSTDTNSMVAPKATLTFWFKVISKPFILTTKEFKSIPVPNTP